MISHDVRFALRLMQKSPGFTAVAVISLALGIGANTAIFSLINAIMLRQMPVERPDQLVEFIQKRPGYDRNDDYEATALTGVCFLEALPAGPHMADASAAVCDGRLKVFADGIDFAGATINANGQEGEETMSLRKLGLTYLL